MEAERQSGSEEKETRKALAAGAGIWACLYGPFLALGSLPVLRDLLLTYLPMRLFWVERVRAGHLPQWFPWEGLGVSFIGQGVTSTFHPVNVLYLALSPALALRLEISLAVLFGIAGAILLARRFELSAPAAVTSALVLVLNGYALSMTNNPLYLRGLASLPWVALCASRVLTSSRPARWTAALAIIWALIPLGGDAAATLMAGLVVGAMVSWHGFSARVGWLVVAAVATVGLAAPELFPAGSLRPLSVLGKVLDLDLLSTRWALELNRLPELVLTGLPLRPQQWAESVVFGAPAITLALCAPRQRKLLGLVLLCVLGLWLALGIHGGLDPVLRRLLPMFNGIRYPEKQLALVAFGLSVLVGFGVDAAPKQWKVLGGVAALVLVLGIVSGGLVPSLAALIALGAIQALRARAPWIVWGIPALMIVVLFREPRALMTLPEEQFLAPVSAELPNGPARIWSERKVVVNVVTDLESLKTLATAMHETRAGSVGALHHQVVLTPSPNLPLWPRVQRQVLGLDLDQTRALAPVYGFDTILPVDGKPFHVEAPPRARLISPRGVASALEAIEGVHKDPAAAIQHPFIIGEAPPPIPGRLGEVRWVSDDLDVLALEAQVEQPSILALHDSSAPGWTATVDGEEMPLVAVNVLSRGVLVPPGRHEVIFRYEAPGLQLGLTVCGLMGVLLLGLIGWEQRRGERAEVR